MRTGSVGKDGVLLGLSAGCWRCCRCCDREALEVGASDGGPRRKSHTGVFYGDDLLPAPASTPPSLCTSTQTPPT